MQLGFSRILARGVPDISESLPIQVAAAVTIFIVRQLCKVIFLTDVCAGIQSAMFADVRMCSFRHQSKGVSAALFVSKIGHTPTTVSL